MFYMKNTALLFCFISLPFISCTAQDAYTIDEQMQTQLIFDKTASIQLPKNYSLDSRNELQIIAGETPYSYQNGYKPDTSPGALSISVFKKKISKSDFYAKCDTFFNTLFNATHCDLLRNEIVMNGDRLYYVLECKLKDEYYNGNAGYFEYGDGRVIPNYFIFYKILDKNKMIGIDQWYDGAYSNLSDFRKSAEAIALSYEIL